MEDQVMLSYLLSTFVTMMFAMQTTSPPAAATTKATSPMLTLSGCVSRDAVMPGAFTFSDADTGAKYRVSGVSLRKFNGQRVEIVGQPGERRVTVRGGLFPSPNLAGQAGAVDPAKAAIANMPGGANTGTGSEQLPAFRVARVRPLSGSCQ
jgi:hypothetical protein